MRMMGRRRGKVDATRNFFKRQAETTKSILRRVNGTIRSSALEIRYEYVLSTSASGLHPALANFEACGRIFVCVP